MTIPNIAGIRPTAWPPPQPEGKDLMLQITKPVSDIEHDIRTVVRLSMPLWRLGSTGAKVI
jgi:hypothetical protein